MGDLEEDHVDAVSLTLLLRLTAVLGVSLAELSARAWGDSPGGRPPAACKSRATALRMRWAMRRSLWGPLAALLLLGSAPAQSRLPSSSPTAVRAALERTFAGCGLSLTRSAHLDRVALAYARLGTVKQAAAEAGYAYQQMQGVRMPCPLPSTVQAVQQRCAVFREEGLIAYGIAPYGQGSALIVADPKIPPNLRGPSAEGKAC